MAATSIHFMDASPRPERCADRCRPPASRPHDQHRAGPAPGADLLMQEKLAHQRRQHVAGAGHRQHELKSAQLSSAMRASIHTISSATPSTTQGLRQRELQPALGVLHAPAQRRISRHVARTTTTGGLPATVSCASQRGVRRPACLASWTNFLRLARSARYSRASLYRRLRSSPSKIALRTMRQAALRTEVVLAVKPLDPIHQLGAVQPRVDDVGQLVAGLVGHRVDA